MHAMKTTPSNHPATWTAFYARVSTDKQEYSLDAQRASALHYAAFKSLSFTGPEGADLTFQDSETSKKSFHQRPGGRQLLNLIHYHAQIGSPIKHLVITKLDRLERTTILFLETFKTLNDLGITLHIVDCNGENLTTAGVGGKLILTILAAVAEWERETIRERTTKTLDHLRSKNILTMGPESAPYGYTAIPIPGATTKSGRQQYNLIPNPAELNTLLDIHQQRAAGKSYHAIAADLNQRGLTTKTGKPWQSGSVAGVLNTRSTKEFLATQQQTDIAA